MLAAVENAVLAGGCFWCLESDLEHLPGVLSAESGYSGGTVARPTYQQVSSETTGHQEVVRVRFDPAKISYATLLQSYWRNVDPLDGGGQFCDRGDSYRPVIFTKGRAAAGSGPGQPGGSGRGAGRAGNRDQGGDQTAHDLLEGRGIPPGLQGAQHDQIQLLPMGLRA